jgi:O-succinylbenzoic acid--CoA ligase
MTETASMIACTAVGDSIEHLQTSGRPLVEGTVSVSDEGEILVRGDTLFQGYLQPDGSLDLPLTGEGWFATGDLGFIDDDGYLHVTGRRDNMFVSGGENIQPEEIERQLCRADGVEEAVVVAVDDVEWGAKAVAFVRMAGGRALNAQQLDLELREALPAYMVPKTFLPWPEDLAETGIKPSRAELTLRARGA